MDRTFEYRKKSHPIFSCNNILAAISEKAVKYKKTGKDFSQITLIIQGTLTESGIPFEFTGYLHRESLKYDFKAIYYISGPKLVSYRGVVHKEDWLVKEIKV